MNIITNLVLKKLNKYICLILVVCFCCFSLACNDVPTPDKDTTPPVTNEPTITYEYANFGSYPTSLVTDSALKNSLLSLIDGTPSALNFNGFADYEYHILGKKESYAFYKDLTFDEAKYRAVYFTKYRPYTSKLDSLPLYSFQDENGYQINTLYFFKFEPLRWRVLEEKNGEKLLLLDIIIDSQPFQPDYYQSQVTTGLVEYGFYYINDGFAPEGTFANSYEYSGIRKYLKNKFYKDAFSSKEKAQILLSTIKNDSASAGQPLNPFSGNDTEDYVYLPSFVDVVNHDYGFKYQGEEDALRQLTYTDYARCQGGYYDVQGEYKWWLRSAPFYINKYSCNAQAVGNSGKIYNYHYAEYTCMGVVPMMCLSID